VYMDCTTAVSNAGNNSWIESSMGSLPGSSAIGPVPVIVMPSVLGDAAGPGLRWASRATVRARSTTLMSTSGVFGPLMPDCVLGVVPLSCARWIVSCVLGGVPGCLPASAGTLGRCRVHRCCCGVGDRYRCCCQGPRPGFHCLTDCR